MPSIYPPNSLFNLNLITLGTFKAESYGLLQNYSIILHIEVKFSNMKVTEKADKVRDSRGTNLT